MKQVGIITNTNHLEFVTQVNTALEQILDPEVKIHYSVAERSGLMVYSALIEYNVGEK